MRREWQGGRIPALLAVLALFPWRLQVFFDHLMLDCLMQRIRTGIMIP